MPLERGACLGPYEIVALIGAGGMGEVYKARDTRLDRAVAIKISKKQFDERFEREARAVAALNHPHICTLYDVGPTDCSPDGRFVLLGRLDPKTQSDLLVLETGAGREPAPYLVTPFHEYMGRFSPDGRWIAYASNDSGSPQVYVRPFAPGKPASGVRRQVSTQGGNLPIWRGDGKELLYHAAGGKPVAVSVQAQGETFRTGTPVTLFEFRPGTFLFPGLLFDVTRDGQRFLLTEPVGDSGSQSMTVVLNWQAAKEH